MKIIYTPAEAIAAMDLIKAIAKEKGTVSNKEINEITIDELIRRDKNVCWNADGNLEMTVPEEDFLKIVKVLRKHVVPMASLYAAAEGIVKSFMYVLKNMRDELKALGL